MKPKPKDMTNPENIIRSTKACVLEETSEALSEIAQSNKEEEVYFHDIVTKCIDAQTPTDRKTGMALIDYANIDERYIDDGIIDKSSLNRFVITMAYECLHEKLFEDKFFQEYLQGELNNETIGPDKAREIRAIIEGHKHVNKLYKAEYTDNETNLYITTAFSLSPSDFKEPFFPKGQIVDFHDGSIKIHTSNVKVNRNAIVLEKMSGQRYRIYMMDKDNDLDIRKFFHYSPTIKDKDYSLDPKEYIDAVKRDFKSNEKHKLIYYINQMAEQLLERR